MKQQKKMRFEYEGTTPGSVETETMWVLPVSDGFEVDNVPFYVRGIAVGDVVSASDSSAEVLEFESLVNPSEHSTVRLWFAKNAESSVAQVRQSLREIGCASELSDLPRLVAVDIPPSVPYLRVLDFLTKPESADLFEYEEACLGVQQAKS